MKDKDSKNGIMEESVFLLPFSSFPLRHCFNTENRKK